MLAFISSPQDWMVIFLIVFLLFGAKKLPELARGFGKAMGEFKKARDEFEREITHAVKQAEVESVTKEPVSTDISYDHMSSAPEHAYEYPGTTPDISHEHPVSAPDAAHDHPGTPADISHEHPVSAPDTAHDHPGTPADISHEHVSPAPEFAHELTIKEPLGKEPHQA